MQQRDPAHDERVSRGPAESDGGVSGAEVGPGGRGVGQYGEHLNDLEQQAGLDAPYGDRTTGQEQTTLEPGQPAPAAEHDRPGDVGSAQGETPGKVAGTQF
jgi:hypothetical protein